MQAVIPETFNDFISAIREENNKIELTARLELNKPNDVDHFNDKSQVPDEFMLAAASHAAIRFTQANEGKDVTLNIGGNKIEVTGEDTIETLKEKFAAPRQLDQQKPETTSPSVSEEPSIPASVGPKLVDGLKAPEGVVLPDVPEMFELKGIEKTGDTLTLTTNSIAYTVNDAAPIAIEIARLNPDLNVELTHAPRGISRSNPVTTDDTVESVLEKFGTVTSPHVPSKGENYLGR